MKFSFSYLNIRFDSKALITMTSSRTDQNLLENAKTLTQSLVISDDNLRKFMSLLESEFQKGLTGDEKAVIALLTGIDFVILLYSLLLLL